VRSHVTLTYLFSAEVVLRRRRMLVSFFAIVCPFVKTLLAISKLLQWTAIWIVSVGLTTTAKLAPNFTHPLVRGSKQNIFKTLKNVSTFNRSKTSSVKVIRV